MVFFSLFPGIYLSIYINKYLRLTYEIWQQQQQKKSTKTFRVHEPTSTRETHLNTNSMSQIGVITKLTTMHICSRLNQPGWNFQGDPYSLYLLYLVADLKTNSDIT